MSKIWRHKKTGGLYIILHHAKMQAADWLEKGDESVDMKDVIVYQSLQDDEIWVRPKAEFHERFENLNSAEYRSGSVVLKHDDSF